MAECRTILNERGQTVEETNNNYVEHQNDHHHQDRLEDHPSLRLLFTIALHVNYSKENLECLATDVGMGKGLFTQRTADVHDVQSKIKKVWLKLQHPWQVLIRAVSYQIALVNDTIGERTEFITFPEQLLVN